MGFLDGVRGIVWPSSIIQPQPGAIKALSDATVPRERDWTVNWSWQDSIGGAITLPGPTTQTYAEIYRRQLWVRVVVDKLAHDIGRLPLKSYGYDDTGQRARLRSGPLADLMRAPYARWSPARFKGQLVADLATYGNAIVVKGITRPEQTPEWLLPVSPHGWYLNEAGDYVRRSRDGQEKVYRDWQIVHFFFPTPASQDFGITKLESLRETLAIDYAARMFGKSVFENHAQPSGGLSTDQDLPPASLERLKAQLNARHVGIGKAGRPILLTNGLKWQPFSFNVNDSAVIDHRKLSKEEVCSVYDIPPPVVGILDRATFSNINEQHIMYYMDTLGKWLNLIEETLDAQLIAPCPALRGNFLEFDINEVLKGNIDARYTALNKAVGGPWMSRAEARRLENLPDLQDEEYERLLGPLNMSTDAPALLGPDGVTPAEEA